MNQRIVVLGALVAVVVALGAVSWWLPRQRQEAEYVRHEEQAQKLIAEKRPDEAEAHLKAAVEIADATFGEGDDRLDHAVVALADYYRERGQKDEIHGLYMRSLSMRVRNKGLDDPSVAEALVRLADASFLERQLDTAEVTYRQALTKFEKSAGADSLAVADVAMKLGEVYRARDDHKGAEPYFARAAGIRRKLLAGDDPVLAATLEAQAATLRALDRGEEATAVAAEAQKIRAALTSEGVDDEE